MSETVNTADVNTSDGISSDSMQTLRSKEPLKQLVQHQGGKREATSTVKKELLPQSPRVTAEIGSG